MSRLDVGRFDCQLTRLVVPQVSYGQKHKVGTTSQHSYIIILLIWNCFFVFTLNCDGWIRWYFQRGHSTGWLRTRIIDELDSSHKARVVVRWNRGPSPTNSEWIVLADRYSKFQRITNSFTWTQAARLAREMCGLLCSCHKL